MHPNDWFQVFSLKSIDIDVQYRTGDKDPVENFYRPCLSHSVEYDRAVGYFRSSIYLIVGVDTVEFAKRGGKIRLICSPSLSKEDIDVISASYEERGRRLGQVLESEIDNLLSVNESEYRTKVLATLIAGGALDIKIAYRPDAYGLYHEKTGVFTDGLGNRVSFVGSSNETWNAWHYLGNHEAIEVFCSWKSQQDLERTDRHEQYFSKLWDGLVDGVSTIDFPIAAQKKLLEVSLGGVDDIDVEKIQKRKSEASSVKRKPLPHQVESIDAWKKAGSRGILEHATGSGKTFTAITAMQEHLNEGKPVIVLVPSQLLLDQWALEIEAEVPDAVLLLAGAGNDRWKQSNRLRAMTSAVTSDSKRVIIATMQTAATDVFISGVSSGDHLMVVADEVHQSGSPFNSKFYQINTGPRLGLSATPTRYGDPDGTQKMFEYFGGLVPPKVTLVDAINSGRLVEYEYFPHPTYLTPDESDEWKRLTLQIIREISSNGDQEGKGGLTDKAKMLLIRRSRIAKKASNKITLAQKVITECYEEGSRWLIYCEDQEQVGQVMEVLRVQGMAPIEYHTGMDGNRAATLDWFKTFGGILVSIKCLDEGVDIPTIDHALILASSQNPRQFIQRRGRVLRKAPNKYLARIHDAIVVPVSLIDEPQQLALLKSEFVRAIEFADGAINRGAAADLRRIAGQLGFDPDERIDEGLEDE